MKATKFRLPSPAMVIAIVALIAATTGSAVAASSLITSAKIKNGTIKLADISSSTKKSLKKGTVGPKGDKGDTGATGPPGAPGAAGPGARWALVKDDGTIVAQSGGISLAHHSTGWYYLNFGASTTGKVLSANPTYQSGGLGRSATVDKCGDDAALGSIFCSYENNSNGVFVQIANKDGVKEDGTFYVSLY